MKTPRISTLIIIGQSILLLICLGYLAVILVRNYCLKIEAKRYAASVGISDATRSFARGHIWLYEIKQYKFEADDSGKVPTDGDIEPSNKKDGEFQIYYFLVDESFPYGHLETQQAYVDAYNERMRLFFNHPEWFDKNGWRIPLHELKQTNNLSNSN